MEKQRFISDQEIDRILGRMGEFKATGTMEKIQSPEKPVYKRVDKTVVSEKSNYLGDSGFTFSYLLDNKSKQNLSQTFDNKEIFQKAGSVRIFYAFITDLCVISLLSFAFLYVATVVFGLDSFVSNTYSYIDRFSFLNVPGIFISVIALFGILSFIYFIYFETLIGQTIGKMFMNVKITDRDGQRVPVGILLFRTLLFFIPPLGLLNLHNKISGTVLVKK